ncbi:MAG TPA: hypothetical protein VMS08_04875 [Candidatus Saccharimonadia bacterium]|nr:hypothetical protein [Candidatus Saccharimonadia bacterium]
MPVMVLYKDKRISLSVAAQVTKTLADVTKAELGAPIEVRIVEPVDTYNANELHIEMGFRDFGEWTDKQLENYHASVMKQIEVTLRAEHVACAFSFYIVPSMPPRSLWAQTKL